MNMNNLVTLVAGWVMVAALAVAVALIPVMPGVVVRRWLACTLRTSGAVTTD